MSEGQRGLPRGGYSPVELVYRNQRRRRTVLLFYPQILSRGVKGEWSTCRGRFCAADQMNSQGHAGHTPALCGIPLHLCPRAAVPISPASPSVIHAASCLPLGEHGWHALRGPGVLGGACGEKPLRMAWIRGAIPG